MLKKLVIVLLIVLLSSIVFAEHQEWYAQTDCYEKSRPNIEHCQQQYEKLRQAHYDTCVNPSSGDCHQYCQQFIDEHRWECEQKCRDELPLAHFRYLDCLEGKGSSYRGVYDYDEDYDLRGKVPVDGKKPTLEVKSAQDTKPKLVPKKIGEPFGKLTFSKGQLKMVSGGKVEEVTDDFEFRTGDVIHTGEDGGMEIATEDGMVRLGKNTTVEFIGLKFDPVPGGRIIYSPDAQYTPDPESFEYKTNRSFWIDVWNDIVDFNKAHPPKHLPACFSGSLSCPYDIAEYIRNGTGWFDKKIKKDFQTNMVVTPTTAITTWGTEFTVDVADDGTTTVTTLDGIVVVTDLTSRKSVMVGVNNQLTVTSEGLEEQELQQSIIKIDPKSIDRWWTQYTDNTGKILLLVFSTLFLVGAAIVGITALIIRKRAKPETTAWGTTSLVFGIIGILLFLASYMGLSLSIGAIWFSTIQKKHKLTKRAKKGLVLGIIGTILNVAFLTLMYLGMQ